MNKRFVYIGKRSDGILVSHTDLAAMESIDGVADVLKRIPIEEFETANGLVREINGEIVVGKTEGERAEELKQANLNSIKQELIAIDQEAVAGRAVREIALISAKKNGIEGYAFDNLQGFEARADALRKKLASIKNAPALPGSPRKG